jgi:hypothetical protein
MRGTSLLENTVTPLNWVLTWTVCEEPAADHAAVISRSP